MREALDLQRHVPRVRRQRALAQHFHAVVAPALWHRFLVLEKHAPDVCCHANAARADEADGRGLDERVGAHRAHVVVAAGCYRGRGGGLRPVSDRPDSSQRHAGDVAQLELHNVVDVHPIRILVVEGRSLRPCAEASVLVVAVPIRAAVRRKNHHTTGSRRNAEHFVIPRRSGRRERRRCWTRERSALVAPGEDRVAGISLGAVAQLAVSIVPPRHHCPIQRRNRRVMAAHGNVVDLVL
mmetsp:Transcript_153/g.366  ORF Transcript_153/g.366 Transcript_153/m.366 type:complete len:239 (+) Transcript_153:329-1045(+)